MAKTPEVWRAVVLDRVAYPYEVSSHGRVRRGERVLKPRRQSAGYLSVRLCAHGRQRDMLVHRLVALAFIANQENREMVNHGNGRKTDNRVTNLSWVTRAENMQHAARITTGRINQRVRIDAIIAELVELRDAA